jgi:hypothetical protein
MVIETPSEGHARRSEPDDGSLVGMTGARFGGAQRRRKRRPPSDPAAASAAGPAPESPAAPPAKPVVGRTGARFARAEREPAERVPEPEPEPEPPVSVLLPDLAPPVTTDDPDIDQEIDGEETAAADGIRVRPYVLTGGRTRATRELSIESLVSIGPRGGFPGRPVATPVQQQVMDVCAQPRSIAEVAALVRVPLGVARVLVADLADTGAVSVHATVTADVDLMRRVLVGLHRL